MATYTSIQQISRASSPATTLAYGGTCSGSVNINPWSAPAYPPSQIFEYEPYSVAETLYDPTKGSNRAWSRIKNSGEISMTDYSRSSTTVRNLFVTRDYDLCNWRCARQGCWETATANQIGPTAHHTLYKRNSTIVEYVNSICDTVWNDKIRSHISQIADAVSTTQQAAFASATSTYDPLTEIAEFGETLKFVQNSVKGAAKLLSKLADTDPKTFKAARKLNAKQLLRHADKKFQSLGSRWMAYRYSIMPIYYSIRDINDLMKHADDEYKTGRSKQSIVTNIALDDYVRPAEADRAYKIGYWDTTVRSTFKVRYTAGSLQRLISQTSFNPFLTAWELIPLSHVVDWFWNVNDAVIAATRIDSSSESLGSTAIKTISNDKIWLHDNSIYRASFNIAAWYNLPAYNLNFTKAQSTSTPLQEKIVKSYDRRIFTRPEPKIVFDPSMNWKRIIDSLVLSHQPIKKLLRSLR